MIHLFSKKSNQGSCGSTPPKNVGETQRTRDLHRTARGEIVDNRGKAEEELRFLRRKDKALEKSTNGLPTIGAVLVSIQRRLDDIEAGYR